MLLPPAMNNSNLKSCIFSLAWFCSTTSPTSQSGTSVPAGRTDLFINWPWLFPHAPDLSSLLRQPNFPWSTAEELCAAPSPAAELPDIASKRELVTM